MEFASKLSYIKDRVPETYISWSLGVYFEPRYSFARVILAKFILLLIVVDDTYDAYGTIEELRLFTDAINRSNFYMLVCVCTCARVHVHVHLSL